MSSEELSADMEQPRDPADTGNMTMGDGKAEKISITEEQLQMIQRR